MKIIIVGGGTAGWLAAYMLSSALNFDLNITLIESSSIGIIGTGEGSTGTLTNLIHNEVFADSRLNEEEFINESAATVKYGIKHINWTGDNSYYFAPIDGSWTGSENKDLTFAYALNSYGKKNMHLCSDLGHLYHHNLNNLVEPNSNHAYHFDGHLIGKYFKKICNNINVIDDIIKDVTVDSLSGNISSIITERGLSIDGDFFIDCTGFNRILSKKLKLEWKSFKKYLPVDSAIPFQLSYQTDEYPCYTLAKAMKYGWQWQIPTADRLGCGYVFDSTFINFDDAIYELEKDLHTNINPIKEIKFTSGKIEKSWFKNCLSIGLSNNFLEPLEATSIHTTIILLQNFIFNYLTLDINLLTDENYYKRFNNDHDILMDNLKDFIQFHYLGNRNDTNFWKNFQNGNIEITDQNLEICSYLNFNLLNNTLFPDVNGIAGWPLWSFVAAGIDKISKDSTSKFLKRYDHNDVARLNFEFNQHLISSKLNLYPKNYKR